ncbi:LacI family DNA-binding transcriptional regulator [Oceanobacillus timonensis]|uniref:LacI family DNA-binding transcriptional regulator n=1 Tax=Oceanobacillus timonensis TaxID=1926285 RepID=UPI0009B98173|nr:LacI family DNA-binding transcriptional regulator [Oceanobacillus timonensis]
MATIRDISEKAGVAKSTVSRYLNNGYVSEATKKKIEQTIEELEYIPNSYAQNLRLESNPTIGVIIPRFDSYSVTTTLQGIDKELKQLHYNILIENTDRSSEREIEYLKRLAKMKVSGIIFLATKLTEEHIHTIESIEVPVIIIGQEDKRLNCIVYKDYEAAFDLAELLTTYDFQKIAYLGVDEADKAVGILRKKGFIDRFAKEQQGEVSIYYTDFSIENAVHKTNKLLNEIRPDLLICATDNIAIGAMKSIYEKKLRIPEDISVTGFGDYQISSYLSPALTTVHYDYNKAGYIAAKNIVRMKGKKSFPTITHINYQVLPKNSIDKTKRK